VALRTVGVALDHRLAGLLFASELQLIGRGGDRRNGEAGLSSQLRGDGSRRRRRNYDGSGGFVNMRGAPERQESSEASRDEATAARLWDRSAELTGVTDDVETLAGENLSRATEATG
jgi:hypothetical protein